jgi:hypothetical protein
MCPDPERARKRLRSFRHPHPTRQEARPASAPRKNVQMARPVYTSCQNETPLVSQRAL